MKVQPRPFYKVTKISEKARAKLEQAREKGEPEKCDGGICVAALACSHKLLKQEFPYEIPMTEPFPCQGCGDCVRACPLKAISKSVGSNGKVTRDELMKNFNLADRELQAQLAILRHCELVKGHKEGDVVYPVPFNFSE